MHPNPAFRGASRDAALAMARQRGFGILSVNGPDGPIAAHIPFVARAGGGHIDAHMARSNQVLQALDGEAPALLAVGGPDGYISPDWYGVADQVPTWNYVAVHIRGFLTVRPQDSLRAHLDRLSAEFEARLAPKPPWTSAKMSAGVMDRMMRMIVPVALRIETVEATTKLSQNKPDRARTAAAAHVADSALADLMRAAG